jgi:hypothetical protein
LLALTVPVTLKESVNPSYSDQSLKILKTGKCGCITEVLVISLYVKKTIRFVQTIYLSLKTGVSSQCHHWYR